MTDSADQSKKEKVKPLTYKTINVDNIVSSNFEDPTIGNASQQISFVKYNENQGKPDTDFIIQTPWIKLEVHGIPPAGDDPNLFFKSDDDVDFMKLPLMDEMPKSSNTDSNDKKKKDKNNNNDVKKTTYLQYASREEYVKEMAKFVKKLKEIDTKLGSKEFKVEKFGAENADSYEYMPIVRISPPNAKKKKVVGKNNDKKKNNNSMYEQLDPYTIKYMKTKFNYKYPKFDFNKDNKNKTKSKKKKTDDSDDDDDESEKKNSKNTYKKGSTDGKQFSTMVYKRIQVKGKKTKKEDLKVSGVGDLRKKMPFKSEIRLLIICNKMWAKTSPDKYQKYEYGPALKILFIEVIPTVTQTRAEVTIDNIPSSDDEDDGPPSDSDDATDTKSKKKPSKKKSDDDDDDDDDDDETEKPKPKSKPSKKEESEEEDSD
jgi:hypothetical protein